MSKAFREARSRRAHRIVHDELLVAGREAQARLPAAAARKVPRRERRGERVDFEQDGPAQ